MAPSGFPADRLDVLQRPSSASLWARDPQYRSDVAGSETMAPSMFGPTLAELRARHAELRAQVERATPEFLIALILGIGLFILGYGLRPLLLSVALMVYGALGLSTGRFLVLCFRNMVLAIGDHQSELRKQIAKDAGQ
jgi:hypothetical protein